MQGDGGEGTVEKRTRGRLWRKNGYLNGETAGGVRRSEIRESGEQSSTSEREGFR